MLGEPLACGVKRDPDPLVQVRILDLGSEHFAAWRDRRLLKVSAATVLREWNMLSAACTRAVREWRWLHENPMRQVSRPAAPQPRSRRVTDDEISKIIYVCGYEPDIQLKSMQARVAVAFLFAIETAMRAGEICALKWTDIDLAKRIAQVRAVEPGARKTGIAWVIPLSKSAIAILKQLEGIDGVKVFSLKPFILEALFSKAKKIALIDDLH